MTSDVSSPPIFGRTDELRRLGERIAAARTGQGSVLFLRGDAGIGKSTLLDAAARVASGCNVVAVRGVQGESHLAFAVLADLVEPLAAGIERLPDSQRFALEGVRSGTGAGNPLAVCAGTLTLLTDAAQHEPLLLLVDDAQWIDPASADAIGFALHRIESDPIVALVAVRAHDAGNFDPGPFALLDLDGLDGAAAGELLGRTAPIQADVAAACVTAVGGNPLALLELDRTLDEAQRRGRRPLDDPPPVGAALGRLVGRRIESLPAESRAALVLVAIGAPFPAPLPTLLERLDLDPHALDEPEAAGIITRAPVLEFAHPLLRAAALDGAAPGERRRTHRVLAAAFATAGDEDRAAWHLANAADGPDERAATALEAAGERAVARGATTGAVDAFEYAARLTSAKADRARRLFLAGRAAWDADAPDVAARLLREAVSDADPQYRAEYAFPLGMAIGWNIDMHAGIELLHEEGERSAADFPRAAVALLSGASALLSMCGELERAIELSDRAVEVAERSDELARLGAIGTRAIARLTAGDVRAETDLAMLDALIRPLPFATVPDLLDSVQLVAFTQLLREMWDEGSATLDRLTTAARQLGLVGVLGFASAIRADIDWRTGHWAHARAHAAVDIEQNAARQPGNAFFGHAVLARVESGLGLYDSAAASADAALAQSQRIGMQMLEIWARAALGFLAVTRTDPEGAVEQLELVWRILEAGSVGDPGVLWWQGDLAEAYVALGLRKDAQRLHEYVHARTRETGRGWGRGIEARLRGLIEEDTGAAGSAFRQSASIFDALGAPFEAARSRLLAAELVSERDPSLAVGELEIATATFAALGASPWSARAQRARSQPGASSPPATSVAGELDASRAPGRGRDREREHQPRDRPASVRQPAHRRRPSSLDLSQARRAHSHRAGGSLHAAVSTGTD